MAARKDPDSDLLAVYQRRICDLELTVSSLSREAKLLSAPATGLPDPGTDYRELFDFGPTGYIVHNHAGYILNINRAASAMLGLKPAQLQGLALTQFVSREETRLLLDHLRRCVAHDRATTELSLVTRNGHSTPVELVSVAKAHLPSQRSSEFRSAVVNVSRRRAVEAARDEAQRDYHQLIDAVEGIVWEADGTTLDIRFVSGYAERLLGYPKADWFNSGFWENHIYVDDRERVLGELARAVSKRQKLRTEYRVVTADRRLVWLQDNVVTNEHDGQVRLLGVAVDVTERHLAQEQLGKANDLLEERVAERTTALQGKLEELEAFSYSLSHDMRSPLRAMQGYATVVERMAGEKLGPRALEYLQRIMNSAERLDLLIRDVLNYSRVASAPVELAPIQLERVVENILNDYPTLVAVRDQIEIQRPMLPVIGHEAFLGQALSNLLTNAVKFMPPDREPHLRVWTEPAVQMTGRRKAVRVWVEDNGLGIAPEDQKRVFRIFERIHPVNTFEGTGIGLAIVQKAVERMGGRVGLQSTPGEGSRFWIELQRAEA